MIPIFIPRSYPPAGAPGEQQVCRECASPSASAEDEDVDDNSGPGNADDDGHDDNSGPGSGDDDGHDDSSGRGGGGDSGHDD